MKKKITASSIWGLIYPMLLYVVVQFGVMIVMMMALSFSAFVALHNLPPTTIIETVQKLSNDNILVMLLISQIITIPILAIWLRKDIKIDKEMGIYKKYKGTFFLKYLFIVPFGLTTMLCANYFVSILQMFMPEFMATSYDETSVALSTGPVIIQILATAVGAPIVEELMFRGVIYRRIRRMVNVIPAAIITSLLFGIYHGNWIQGPYAFLVGLACVFVYERYKSIIAPIILHGTANFFATIVSICAGNMGNTSTQQITKTPETVITLVIVTAAMGVLTFLLYRVIKKSVIPEELER